MHELSLTENLRAIIEREAKRQGFTRVRRVILEVGELSCVAPEALEFCFGAVMANSPAEGAMLEIVPIPGRGRCARCGQEAAMAELYEVCSNCLGPLTVIQGLAVQLQALAVEWATCRLP